jgi:hypothetical protein
MRNSKILLLLVFLTILIVPVLTHSQSGQPDDRAKEIALEKKIKDVANSVSELKEKVYQSKARIKLLEETLLLGKINGSKSIIKFKNNTGGLFQISDGEYYLNGKLIYKLNSAKGDPGSVVVFDGETPPGNNKITIKLTFTGADSGVMKLFSYFKDYKFNLESDYEFPVTYGNTTIVNIESIDQGAVKNTLEDRISVRYKTLTEENSSVPF